MRRQRKIVKIIPDEVYRHDLLFVSGCSLKEANRELKKYKINPFAPEEEPKGVMWAISGKDSPRVEGVALFMWIKDRRDFYTLLHEVSHLCIKVFDLSNMDVNLHTTEAFSFYHEFWFKKLWRLMSKR